MISNRRKLNILASGAKQNRRRIGWASLVEGSVPLVSACNGGGTKRRGTWFDLNGSGSVAAVGMPSTTPAGTMRSGRHFYFIEQNEKVLHRSCATHGSTPFIVRVKGLGSGWCGVYREGLGGGSMLVRN